MKKHYLLAAALCFSMLGTRDVLAQSKEGQNKATATTEKSVPVTEKSTTENVLPVLSDDKDPVLNRLYSAYGPYRNYKPENEILSKRAANAKHFIKDDSTNVAIITAGDNHYWENGGWRTAANEISAQSDVRYPLANVHNEIKTYYGGNLQTGIRVVAKEKFRLEGFAPKGIYAMDAQGNLMSELNAANPNATPALRDVPYERVHIDYNNVYPGTRFSLEQMMGQVKTNYVITQNMFQQLPAGTEYVVFSERLTVPAGVKMEHAAEGNTEKLKGLVGRLNGEVIFTYSDAIFFDDTTNGRRGKGGLAQLDYVLNGTELELFIKIPALILRDSTTQFPFTVDPLFAYYLNPPNTLYATGTMANNCDWTNNVMQCGFIDGNFFLSLFGWRSSSSNADVNCYAQFTLNTSILPSASCIVSTDLSLYQYDREIDDNNMRFRVGHYPGNAITDNSCTNYSVTQNMSSIYAQWRTNYADWYDYWEGGTGYYHDFYLGNSAAFGNQLLYNAANVGWMAIGFDQNHHADDCSWCWGSETDMLAWHGYANTNKPQLKIVYISNNDPNTAQDGLSSADPVLVGALSCGSNYSNTRSNAVDWCALGNIGQSSADIWYSFTLSQTTRVNVSNTAAFSTCVTVYNSSLVSQGSTCSSAGLQLNLAAGTYYVVSEGSGSNSGNITTNISVPASSVGTLNSTSTINFCSSSPAITRSISGFAGTSIQWQYATEAAPSTWVNWPGATSATSPTINNTAVFGKKLVSPNTNYDRVRVAVTNAGCATVYSGSFLVNNRYNEDPTSITLPSSPACAGGVIINANFPNAVNMNGNVEFYLEDLLGNKTFLGSSPGNGTSTVSFTATAAQVPANTFEHYFRARYNPGSGTGCSPGDSSIIVGPYDVVGQPGAPTSATSLSPGNGSTVCVGTPLTFTGPAVGGNTSVNTSIEYRFTYSWAGSDATPPTTWQPFSGPSVTITPTAAGNVRVQARRVSSSAGCNASAWSTLASWNVVAAATSPTTATKVPNLASLCGAQTGLTLAGAATGGTDPGCVIEYYGTNNYGGPSSYSTNNADWSTTIPTLTGIVGQSSAIWARRYCASITGCTYSSPNLLATWSIVAEPTSPTTATKSPNQLEVCELIPLTITAAATGGNAGIGCSIEYRYSLNNGSTWTTTGTTIPSFNSTNTGDNIIEVRRNNCQAECDQPTAWTEIARWQVTAGATSPFNVSKSPNTTYACMGGGNLTASATDPDGCTIQYRYSTDNGATWSSITSTAPSVARTPGVTIIQARKNVCVPDCGVPQAFQDIATWNVNALPAGRNFATAIDLGGLTCTILGDTKNNDPANCYGNDLGFADDDIFYTFEHLATGRAIISSCGSSIPATIRVYNSSQTLLYDNGSAQATACSGGATIDIPSLPAGDYYVVLESNGTPGDLALTVSLPLPGGTIQRAGANAGNLEKVCYADNNVQFTVAGLSGTVVNWSVNSSDASATVSYSGSNATVTMNTATTATVNLTTTNGSCNATATYPLTVYATPFNVTGGTQASCVQPQTPRDIGLDGSQAGLGVNYLVYLGGVYAGYSEAGTGSALSYTINPPVAGNYTIVATTSSPSCNTTMTGSASIVSQSPTVYNITPSSATTYCNVTGGPVGLDGTDNGTTYFLYFNNVITAYSMVGDGTPMDFPSSVTQTLGTGSYSIRAEDPDGCTGTMNGNVVITVSAPPTAPNMSMTTTPANNYCSAATARNFIFTASNPNYVYTLKVNGSAVPVGTGGIIGGNASGNPHTGATGSITWQVAPALTGTFTLEVTISGTTGCEVLSTSTYTINQTPATPTLTGGATTCNAANLVTNPTEVGVKYYLRRLTTAIVDSTIGDGLSYTWAAPYQPSTSYTVVAVNEGCSATSSPNVTVSGAGPTTSLTYYSVTGSVSCAPSTISITNSQGSGSATYIYDLFRDGVNTGISITSNTTGAKVLATNQPGGVYTVRATLQSTGCIRWVPNSFTVNPAPTEYTVSLEYPYCVGSPIPNVVLSNSEIGVDYELRDDGVAYSTLSGTGTQLTWGNNNLPVNSTYTVVATHTTSSCTANMNGSPFIPSAPNPLPVVYEMTPTSGSVCMGNDVGLTDSETGVEYYLMLSLDTSGTEPGTGSAIGFGAPTEAGVYTVQATNTSSGCTALMDGSVTVAALPEIFMVTGGGPFCDGQTATIGLDTSQSGVNYQLVRSGVNTGSPVAGSSTGAAITFGDQTSVGDYTVVGIDANSNCTNNMNGTVTISPTPTEYSVAGGGDVCSDAGGATVTLSGSDIGTDYQLVLDGTTPVGSPVAGTGSGLNWSGLTGSGIYNVVATGSTGCDGTMADFASVNIIEVPAAPTVSIVGDLCGDADLEASLSGDGVLHFQNTNASGVDTSTTYQANVTGNGTYYFRAVNQGCWGPAGSIAVTLDAIPPVPVVTVSGNVSTTDTTVRCGSTVLTATPVNANEVVWYQGTNAGGINELQTSPQTVGVSNTYYYRTKDTLTSCWSNDAVTALTVSPTLNVLVNIDECMTKTGGNDMEYVYLTSFGGTPSYTFNAPGGAALVGAVSSDTRLYEVPITGSTYTFGVTDSLGCLIQQNAPANNSAPTEIPILSAPGTTQWDSVGCFSTGYNKWVYYRSSTNSNQIIAAINDKGQDLGLVSVELYVDPTQPNIKNIHTTGNGATADGSCVGQTSKALRRHFVISATNPPSSPIGIRLFFSNDELTNLISATNVPLNTCDATDSVDRIEDLHVIKWHSSDSTHLENGAFADNDNDAAGIYKLMGPNATTPVTPVPFGATDHFSALFPGGSTVGPERKHYVEFEVSDLSEFWLGGSFFDPDAPLPVELISLEAEPVNNAFIRVKWATALEIDNRGFHVERSTDAQTWSTIGWVDGHNNSTVQRNYSLNDMNVVGNVRYYYRLKQVDNDGDFTYTHVVSAMINTITAFSVKDFQPNPAGDQSSLIVTTSVDQEIDVEVFNVIGEKVLSSKHRLHKGGNLLTFDFSTLAGGTYTAVVTSVNDIHTKRLIIAR